MNRVTARIWRQDGSVLCLVLLVCVIQTNTAMAQQAGTLKQERSTQALAAQPADRTPELFTDKRTKTDRWFPQDIDRVIPPVGAGAPCPLAEVLSQAGKRIQELVGNVDKFTATEVVEHQSVDRSGQLRHPETQRFSYLVSITQMPSGGMNVEEYRNGGSSLDQFPDHIASLGTPALVLIFHPQYAKNFRMMCEGLGQWHEQPAWQVRFEENTDRHSPISAVVIERQSFDLRLRGRAWILTDSYHVARLESDLADEVPQLRLRLLHEDIEYRSVHSNEDKGEIWLPSSSEVYMDFRGHRFYRRHRFTDIRLFSVSLQQTFGDPKE